MITLNPFTPEAVAAAASPLSELRCHDGSIYWITRYPNQGGRQVVLEHNPHTQKTRHLTPDGYSAQSRVHEYGGGCYALSADSLYFVNSEDQRIYQQPLNLSSPPVALTPKGSRYGDLCVSPNHRFLIAVREQHTEQGILNDLIQLNLSTHSIDILASGDDFYASPAVNPNNTELIFLSWSHPDMPWEKTILWKLELESKKMQPIINNAEAIYQPGYTPSGQLFYVSDQNGWWNLYVQGESVLPMTADCGYPLWVLGTNQVVFSDEHAWLICGAPGQQCLLSQDKKLNLPFTDFQPTLAYNNQNHCLYFIAGSYHEPDALYQYNLNHETLTCIEKSTEHSIHESQFSKPTVLQITQDSALIHGFYYPPCPASDTPPPMIVNSHGGPNACATTQCQFKIQFWTSRGFAYLDVNYRGSTGYGRDFRRALNGKWGVADVEDCCRLTLSCVRKKMCDPNRLFIRGQSAGGLTALSACIFHSLFAGGVSYYGVSDLTTLLHETHKFESHYLEKLIGPYCEKSALYLARSPAYHLDQLEVPLLFLQGLEDRIVPVQQTQTILDKLNAEKKRYQYIEFADEGHGFKRAENIIAALQAELNFYLQLNPDP